MCPQAWPVEQEHGFYRRDLYLTVVTSRTAGRNPARIAKRPVLRLRHGPQRHATELSITNSSSTTAHERVVVALPHHAHVPGRVVGEVELLHAVVVRRPIDQAERQSPLPAGQFELFHVRPVAGKELVADRKMIPVHVQAEKVQPTHVHLLEPDLERVDECQQLFALQRRIRFDVADANLRIVRPR